MEVHDGLTQRRMNRDGSCNIYCKRCHRLVGTNNGSSGIVFGSVTACAICVAADEDIVLPDDVIEGLNSVRLPNGYLVPEFVVVSAARRDEEAQKTDPMGHDPENNLNQRYWFRAATLGVIKSIKERLTKSESKAQQLARDKKRKRIFERSIEDALRDSVDE